VSQLLDKVLRLVLMPVPLLGNFRRIHPPTCHSESKLRMHLDVIGNNKLQPG